jgi:hypothetical protein
MLFYYNDMQLFQTPLFKKKKLFFFFFTIFPNNDFQGFILHYRSSETLLLEFYKFLYNFGNRRLNESLK